MATDFPLLIGVHGVKQAGKDTAFTYIKEFFSESRGYLVNRRGFADEMKLALARIFFGDQPWLTMEWAVNWADSFKEHPNAFIEVPFEMLSGGISIPSGVIGTRPVQFRDLMRFIGTDVGRNMWGEDFWVDKLLPTKMNARRKMADDHFGSADVCVITDVRFENECRRISSLGGQVWKVRRPIAEDRLIAEYARQGRQVHASDLLLPDHLFDKIFDKHGDMLAVYREHIYAELTRLTDN